MPAQVSGSCISVGLGRFDKGRDWTKVGVSGASSNNVGRFEAGVIWGKTAQVITIGANIDLSGVLRRFSKTHFL